MKTVSAKVINAGVDGIGSCGWQIVIDDTAYYHPDNLPENLKQDNLQVSVHYTNTKDTFFCGDFVLSAFRVMHIISIRPK